ncbi:hypothetical protein PGT21_018622 [Puccinia graminis f. sp. tritici]|uniref:Uncharacterized protein n=1 Tax=Puccinia graminis f. sp. tritici TaxID=56615 RepID=A0A5B0QBJ8_PUCGR|nr:hypothetical protein PGT21_018622 [Puccinia graminis f. sp. tritici]
MKIRPAREKAFADKVLQRNTLRKCMHKFVMFESEINPATENHGLPITNTGFV